MRVPGRMRLLGAERLEDAGRPHGEACHAPRRHVPPAFGRSGAQAGGDGPRETISGPWVAACPEELNMEQIVNVHIEKLPEGMYLATSDEISGLVAQGRTVTETLEIARDVARKLLAAQAERQERPALKETGDAFDYPLVVSG